MKYVNKSGFRDLVILFIGLNLAWIELVWNSAMTEGFNNLLGWPPFDWYMTVNEWFWTHFALLGLSIAVLLYIDSYD